jgi:hypothetical protein
MNGSHLTAVAGTGLLLGLLLAFQAGAQGQSGGARPSGGTGGAMNAGGLGNGRPRAPEVQSPLRLPQDKAFGEKGKDASAKKAANASSATISAEAGCIEAQAAIAAAGTGGTSGKGQGGAAGAAGRAKAAEAVCSGTDAERAGVTGRAQALPADEHADDGLEKAPSNKRADAASNSKKQPEPSPPR